MKKLFKKLIVDIKKSIGRFVTIIVISMIGTMLLTGMSVIHTSLSDTLNEYYKNSNLADIGITYQSINDKGIAKVKALDNIKYAQGRYSFRCTNKSNNSELLIHSVSQSDKINLVKLVCGNLPESYMECIVSQAYADKNNITVGNSLNIKSANNTYRLKVTGIFNTAEYIYLIKNETESMVPDNKNYGLLYVNKNTAAKISGMDGYSEMLVTLKNASEDSTDKTIDCIKSVTSEYNFFYATKKALQTSYAKLDTEVESSKSMSRIFPYIFFLVCAAIIFITMSRTVQNERTQIGIMMALGIPKYQILLHYVSYAVSACFIGAVTGNIAGILFLPKLQFATYEKLYALPNIHLSGYWHYILFSTIIVILFGTAACILSVFKTLREVPAQCLRMEQSRKVHSILLEKDRKLWNRMSHRSKLIFRNIFLNKRRVFLSALGTAGCVGLLLCGFGLEEVTGNFIQKHFNQIQKYDYMTVLSAEHPWNNTAVIKSSAIKTIDKYAVFPVSFKLKSNYDSSLYIVERSNNTIQLFRTDGSKIKFSNDGIILPYKTARDNGVKKGDSVNLTIESAEYGNKTISAKVADICELYISQDIYATNEYIKKCGINANTSGYYITLKHGAERGIFEKQLNANNAINSVSIKSKIKDQFNTLFKSTQQTVLIMIILSACLVFSVIFNISTINIFERTRDIATFKVLGYKKHEIYSLIDIENLIVAAFGSILGILFGIFIFRQVLLASENKNMYYPFHVTFSMCILSVILTFAFTILINIMLRGKINRIDMTGSLKSVE